MKVILICILTAVLLAACSGLEMLPPAQPTALLTRPVMPLSSQTPIQRGTTPASQSTLIASRTPTRAATVQTTYLPATATQSVLIGAGIVLTSGPLTVRIESPADGATIKESRVEVKGQAPAGTVISINDLVLVAASSNTFSAVIELEKGPNLVEFVASDSLGNQVFYALALYCDP